MFIHTVYFWLREDLEAEDRMRFEAGLRSLCAIGGVRHGYVGSPAPTDRAVIDRSYSRALVLVFDDQAAHDAYQVDPVHDRFRDTCGELWTTVRIYDSITDSPDEVPSEAVQPVTVSVIVQASPERAWEAFTSPKDVMAWNFASAQWHCPQAQNELRVGGAFSYRMEARDGSFGFDFAGTFLEVSPPWRLRYALGAEREVTVVLAAEGTQTRVSQSFTPEETHSLEQQREGWQAILEHFKAHVER